MLPDQRPGEQTRGRTSTHLLPEGIWQDEVFPESLFHGDHSKLDATITAINVRNKYALYNFLSTFSGTHSVTPRSLSGELRLEF